MRFGLLVFLFACSAPTPHDISVQLTEVATVPNVTWATDAESTGYVEFGLDEAFGSVSPIGAGTTHSQALIGLPPETEIFFRVVSQGDGPQVESDTYTVRTGPLPGGIPDIEMQTSSSGETPWGEYTLMSWYDSADEESAAIVLNRAGDVVWYHETDGESVSVAFSADRTAVLALGSFESQGVLWRFPLDGTASTSTSAPATHHDFVELPDGRFGMIQVQFVEMDGATVVGDSLVLLEADGTLTELWNAFDHLEVIENDGWSQDPIDWTHANGIAYDPDNDLYLLSLYRQETLVAIDGTSGESLWTIGTEGDFAFVNDDGFGPQHSPELRGDTVMMLDNAYRGERSRLVEYVLDHEAQTATKTWELAAPFERLTYVLGDGDRLPDGGAVVAWGENREVDSFDADGELVRSLVVGGGAGVVANVERTDDLYPVAATYPTP